MEPGVYGVEFEAHVCTGRLTGWARGSTPWGNVRALARIVFCQTKIRDPISSRCIVSLCRASKPDRLLDEGRTAPVQRGAAAGLIFIGGSGRVNETRGWMTQELALIQQAAMRDILPGICFCAQLLSKALVASVYPADGAIKAGHGRARLNTCGRPDLSRFQWFISL